MSPHMPLTTGLAALCVAVSGVAAQVASAYPDRPIRFIVAFPAGSGSDVVARIVGQKLSEALKQNVIIDNRPGANGAIGAAAGAQAPGDGHTLFMLVASHVVEVAHASKLPYDLLRDFAPISLLVQAPYVVVVNPSLPANSIPELIALAKSKPGQLSYASAGTGGSIHLASELLCAMAQIRMVNVPYKGPPPALLDVANGQVQIMIASMATTMPLVRGSKLRALAVTSAKRSDITPELPTVAETLPGYAAITWFGVAAPSETPGAIVKMLGAELAKILQSSEMKQRLATAGMEAVGNAPAEFNTHIRGELARYSRLIKDAGIGKD